MASSLPLFVLLFILSVFSLSFALSHDTILDAADVLSDSGFVSMALTLEVVSQSLLSHSPSITIFAPSDFAFRKSGQPSLDLLRFHFALLPLPLQSLRLLPTGTTIPTMFTDHSLIVTSSPSDGRISLNNVDISESPIYDDGYFLIYGIDRFLDPNFRYMGPSHIHNHNPVCEMKNHTVSSSNSFDRAIETLKSGGYSMMASFLGMQLSGIANQAGMTVFAPVDDVVLNHLGNFSECPSFFRSHVVPCKLLWNDLVNYNDGSELSTYMEGVSINIKRSGGTLNLNGVPVFFPDLYFNDKLVVHGVSDVLLIHGRPQDVVESFSGVRAKPAEEYVLYPGEL